MNGCDMAFDAPGSPQMVPPRPGQAEGQAETKVEAKRIEYWEELFSAAVSSPKCNTHLSELKLRVDELL